MSSRNENSDPQEDRMRERARESLSKPPPTPPKEKPEKVTIPKPKEKPKRITLPEPREPDKKPKKVEVGDWPEEPVYDNDIPWFEGIPLPKWLANKELFDSIMREGMSYAELLTAEGPVGKKDIEDLQSIIITSALRMLTMPDLPKQMSPEVECLKLKARRVFKSSMKPMKLLEFNFERMKELLEMSPDEIEERGLNCSFLLEKEPPKPAKKRAPKKTQKSNELTKAEQRTWDKMSEEEKAMLPKMSRSDQIWFAEHRKEKAKERKAAKRKKG